MDERRNSKKKTNQPTDRTIDRSIDKAGYRVGQHLTKKEAYLGIQTPSWTQTRLGSTLAILAIKGAKKALIAALHSLFNGPKRTQAFVITRLEHDNFFVKSFLIRDNAKMHCLQAGGCGPGAGVVVGASVVGAAVVVGASVVIVGASVVVASVVSDSVD